MKKLYRFALLLIGMFFITNPSFGINSTDIYKNAAESMVYVEVGEISGSGVIVEEDGTFVTCFHVVSDADDIEISTKDGKKYKVNGYKYLSPKDDIAILTISSSKTFKPIKRSLQELSVGEAVYTISNPKGIQFVFSDGMISQLDKKEIQFSAPVSSGSSGGALLNSKGELIGIISSQIGPSYAQNLNFAIPNKLFMTGLEKKKSLNTKKQPWTDFIISRGTKKFLKEYLGFALYFDSPQSVKHKISKAIIKKTKNPTSGEKLEASLISILAYLDNPKDKDIIKDVYNMLDKLIAENEEMEKALVLKGFASMLAADINTCKTCIKLLKPYPKSCKLLKDSLKSIEKAKSSSEVLRTLVVFAHYSIDMVLEDKKETTKK